MTAKQEPSVFRPFVWSLFAVLALAPSASAASDARAPGEGDAQAKAAPLTIGDTFGVFSKALDETRRINVYLPQGYAEHPEAKLPVLYMPDGGIGEDFLHVAGLLQVSIGNGTMRPFILVGIENTQRRRDLTGPTSREEDRKIAPVVGGSAAFRRFLREELMPEIARRYRVTDETAIVGESLAGLFVIETLLLEPDLFDTYVAFDPSLWWDGGRLVDETTTRLKRHGVGNVKLSLATSDEPTILAPTGRFIEMLERDAPEGLQWRYDAMPEEKHWTVYHPAALRAFRSVFAPVEHP
ncbi:MAG: alpha/beta hydrolase [Lysobacteraceae bacterium]|nr:MAG: alpha/beta hydrolase [Xanthomonadaceae bacterium]